MLADFVPRAAQTAREGWTFRSGTVKCNLLAGSLPDVMDLMLWL
jgi:hypothetical protein